MSRNQSPEMSGYTPAEMIGHPPPEMIRNKDIVVVGLQPWDIKMGSNWKNGGVGLARYNRGLYGNAPLDQITLLRKKNEPSVAKRREIRKSGKNLLPIGENIWNLYPKNIIHSINWIRGSGLFNVFNKWNNKKFAADIREAIEELSFKDFILFNDGDMLRSFYLIELLQPSLSIYYSRDNLLGTPYFYRHGHILEHRLM